MSGSLSTKRYLVRHVDASTSGPLDKDGLKRLVAQGVVNPDDEICVEGDSRWVSAWKVKGLFAEERLAGYGKPVSTSPADANGSSRGQLNEDDPLAKELHRLAALVKSGLITQSDYDEKKRKLLDLDSAGQAGEAGSGYQLVKDNASSDSHTTRFVVTGEGRFKFSIPYAQALQAVRQAMEDCDVKVKEFDATKGLIRGKARYGINLFGITVVAAFHSTGSDTSVEVTAMLTDAIDTFGATRKKVQQISNRLMDIMAASTHPVAEVNDAHGVVDHTADRTFSRAPSFSERAGPSYRGLAVTGFFFALGGLLIGPLAIAALVLEGIALTKIDTSRNKAGRGWAVTGLVIGFVGLIAWIMMLIL